MYHECIWTLSIDCTQFDRDLADNSRMPMETLVRMGMRIGTSANRARSQMGSPVPSYAGDLAGLSPVWILIGRLVQCKLRIYLTT